MKDVNVDSPTPPAVALPDDAGPPPVGGAPEPSPISAYERLLGLREQLADHRPSDPAVLLWQQQLAEPKALEMGQRVGTDRVLADALAIFPLILPTLLTDPLPGYGPKRAYYGVSLALDLSERAHGLRFTVTEKAGASRVKQDAVADGQRKRQSFQELLQKAALGDSARLAQLDKAAAYDHAKPGELVASLELLRDVGRSLLAQVATNPALGEVYADMGLTAEEVSSVANAARRLTGATGDHGEQIASRQAESDAINVLEGRVWFELRALKQAARDARRRKRSVPMVRLTQLEGPRRRCPTDIKPTDDESPTEPDTTEPETTAPDTTPARQ
ncbi:MAG TPA: hypothetical protein VH877_18505 [Polyangia bacterium]|jgi:hypothetical protein|nr:hypothetical protein [Polyangia bacterium]